MGRVEDKVFYGPDGAVITEQTMRSEPESGSNRIQASRLRRIRRREDIPFAECDALLREHIITASERSRADGGPALDIEGHAAGFWDNLDKVLPPHGSYYLATDACNRLVGTGALWTVAPGVAEMKHLFVRPHARGTGLGRSLVERRMEDARAMGIRTILADTIPPYVEMLALYRSLGFRRVPPQASGAVSVSPELADYMVFLQYDFPK